jgi:PAS domain S-box-containing protein
MAGDSLAERIEVAEQRLERLREHAQATPERQPLLAAAAEDLALALDALRVARDELNRENQERIRTEQSLRLEEARLDALLHLSQISGASLQEIASFTLEQGIALTNSRIGFVGFLNEDESVYTLHAVSKDVVKECNITGDPIEWHVVDAGIWADAIRERRTLFINDYSQPHPGKKGLPAGHPYVERFMVVPVLEDERIVAIAGVGNKASEYDDSDERQILLLLRGMWGYVQRNRSREELEQAYDELEERVQQRTAELSLSNAALQEEITERRRAEEALHEERDRLAALVNSIRDEIWYADTAGQFTLVNPSGSSEFTLEADTTTDVRQLAASLQVLRPDGTPRPIEEAPPLRALHGEVVTNQEELVHTPATGELRSRQINAAPVRDGSGNIIGSVSVVRDVTALKRAEEERERLLKENRRQRAFLEQLIETAPVGLAVVRGPEHRYELVNPCYQAIPGMPEAPLVGRPIAQVCPEVVAQGALEMVEQVYLTGQTVSVREYQASVEPGQGETYWDMDYVPLREPDGPLDGVLILADEVTDQVLARRQVQELADALEQERDVLQTIMENTPAQLAYLDPEFSFVRVNAAYAEGAGHSREELVGRNHFELFPNPENRAIFEGVRDIGEPVAYQARPFEYADQPERGVTYWDWTLVPVKDEAGMSQGVVISLAEVTEQVRARHERERLLAEAQEQRRQAQRASRETEAANHLLRALIETMPIGVIVADGDGTLSMINAAAQAILGSPVAGPVSRPERAYTPYYPDGSPIPQQDMPLVHALAEGQVVRDVEILIRRSDGSECTILASAAPVMDEAGKVVSAVTVFQDITEQRYAEARLRFKADILAQIADAVIAVDGDERVTYLNRRAAELYETDRDEGLGNELSDLYRNEWLDPGAEQEAYASLQARGTWQGENVHVTKSGKRIRVESTVRVLEDDHGRPSGLLATIHDVTAQKEAEAERDRLLEEVRQYTERLEEMVARRTAALQASQARLQAIFDGTAIGIALADLEGRILESNPALQAMLGYTADELEKMAFTEFTHPEDVTADMDLYRELVAGRREEYSLNKRYIRKDGQVMWARLTVSLVRAREDRAPLAIGMIEDITEQKEVQDALLRTEKLAIAGQLGASLAHEINNPLQSVIGCLGLADRNLAAGADVSRYLQVAREELRRAADIVAQLRDLHRLSEPEEKKATDLNDLLEQVLLLCKKKCEECRIKLSWNAADDLPSVLLVPDRMRQVFLNLILNALDATPEGGRLEVSTARTTGTEAAPAGVCISFADSGSGIASDVLPHVFDPFYSTKPQGLGLGLYITHKIVEAHEGRIDVSSRRGEGTIFSVWLPA